MLLVYCSPSLAHRAKNPSGEDINALEQHIKNLLSPSTPDFFNTLVSQTLCGSLKPFCCHACRL
jgi:hypothetical protein